MNDRIQLVSKLLLISACLIASACGFQLRGSVDLPKGIEPIVITGINQSDAFYNTLNNLLNASNIQLADNISDANHQLNIVSRKQDKRTAALGDGARVAEYQLTETLVFELKNKKGEPILGPSSITERKIIPNDPNKVVSSGEEEKILRREMLQNLAAKLTRQLQSFDYPQTQQ